MECSVEHGGLRELRFDPWGGIVGGHHQEVLEVSNTYKFHMVFPLPSCYILGIGRQVDSSVSWFPVLKLTSEKSYGERRHYCHGHVVCRPPLSTSYFWECRRQKNSSYFRADRRQKHRNTDTPTSDQFGSCPHSNRCKSRTTLSSLSTNDIQDTIYMIQDTLRPPTPPQCRSETGAPAADRHAHGSGSSPSATLYNVAGAYSPPPTKG